MFMKRSITISLLSLMLVACGGGSNDDDRNQQDQTGWDPNRKLVEGEYNYMSVTGRSVGYPGMCMNADLYFETDDVIALGDGSETDWELAYAATMVHDALPKIAKGFGMTMDQFWDHMSIMDIKIAADYGATLYSETNGKPWNYTSAFDGKYPQALQWEDPASIFNSEKALWLRHQIAAIASAQEMMSFYEEYLDNVRKIDGDSVASGRALRDLKDYKINVCVSSQMSGYTQGRGHNYGIDIGKSVSDQIVVHELTHYFVDNLAWTVSVPRWLSEGIAVVVAGQNIATKKESGRANPTLVDSILDEGYIINKVNNHYAHYGLATKLLIKMISIEGLTNLLIESRKGRPLVDVYEGMSWEEYNAERDALSQKTRFEYAFEKYVKDENGNQMTYTDFQNRYHELVQKLL